MNKNTILSIAIFVIIGIVVLIYMNGSGNTAEVSDVSVVAQSKISADAQYIISILTKMKGVKLEDPLFNDDIFKGLVDNTVTFNQEEVGRNNPFAPLGQTGTSSAR